MTTTTRHGDEIGPIRRRTIDTVLIAAGAVVAVVLFAAGVLLTWGNNFAEDYVGDELTSQNIFFPDQASLEEEGRDDLVKYADEQVTTGAEAEAYASFINGHLEETADGLTYAELGGPLGEARDALTAAQEAGEDETTIAELQTNVDELTRHATRCSRARRSAACCSRRSPGRRSGASPASPQRLPSSPPRRWWCSSSSGSSTGAGRQR